MAHNFRPKWLRFFFSYEKYAIFNMLKNAAPELNFQSDKIGHLVFIGQSDSELFSLPNWQERPFSTYPVAPPIIISEILEISTIIIGGVTGKVLKIAFLANLASWKAQNLIVPSQCVEGNFKWNCITVQRDLCRVMGMIQGFQINFAWNPRLKGVEGPC